MSSAMSLNDKVEYFSDIYESINGSPEDNVSKIVEMLGGIENLIGENDIVIIKPNAQWHGHAITNTNAIKGFIDMILDMKRFYGEIIVAENHHYLPNDSRGWTTDKRSGDYNLNELILYYQKRGFKNVTKYHWRNGRAGRLLASGHIHEGRIVKSPEEGDGYVWSEKDYEYGGLKTKMSYPIFTSQYSGRRIDFKNGVWEKGSYVNAPIKFINMSGLNHHGNAGVTASIKNYFGVIDMTCGFSGDQPEGYFNFHYIGFNWPYSSFSRSLLKKLIQSKTLRKMKYVRDIIGFIGPANGAMGGAVGYFMKTVRKADLNIITAEYVGHESRWKNPVMLKAVLGSKDPVALDYYASKYILLPLGGKKGWYHDPDNRKNTLHKYLYECHMQGIGTLDEKKMILHKFDFSDGSLEERRCQRETNF